MYRNLGLLEGTKSYITYAIRLAFHCPLALPQICVKFMLLWALYLPHRIMSMVKSNGTVTVK